jgi:GNAT superfamily N-acetyltransferase
MTLSFGRYAGRDGQVSSGVSVDLSWSHPVSDQWMPWLELKLSQLEFEQLPRNAAYKYQYQGNSAWLNPRPRYYHAMLDLRRLDLPGPASVTVRPVQPRDWDELPAVFAEAFRGQQPFSGLGDEGRLLAAQSSLVHTQYGGDGPWIEQASFIAGEPGVVWGAMLITLLPQRDPTEWDSYSWHTPPPPDAIEMRVGRPHLTWIFVRPPHVGRGVGTALLQAAARALTAMGYEELLSTFMLGNDASMLWHWRMGFRLLAYPGSPRRTKKPAASSPGGAGT